MSAVFGLARRVVRGVAGIVYAIRHGEEDMRAVYGEHPNGAPSGEETMVQGSVNLNLSQLGNGGLS